MATTPILIQLEQNQIDALTELEIDTAKLYFVDNDELSQSAPAIQALVSGHHVVFLDGVEADHRLFLNLLYGKPLNYYTLTAKFRQLYIYGSPTEQFAIAKNLATISVATPPTP